MRVRTMKWVDGPLVSSPLPLFRSAYSLLEILVVIVVLSAMLMIIFVTLAGVMRIEKAEEAAHQRMVDIANIGDQFRSDVGQALNAPRQWGQYEAGPTCLILEHGNDTHIVYQWYKRKLTRLHIQAGITVPRLMPGSERAQFSVTDTRQCRLRLAADDGPSDRFPSDITVALGGERR